MTIKLTTDQIIKVIDGGEYPSWEWENAIEINTASDDPEDAKSAARFLEYWKPGQTWSAGQFDGLLYNHLTGRWSSAVEIGGIRAHEDYADDLITEGRFQDIISSDAKCVAYLTSKSGTHVFTETDGTVLTFDGLYSDIETKDGEA
jgi:hypothetical protein